MSIFRRWPFWPSFARFKKNQDGAVAIEFALVAAPFIYLLLCIFEYGMLFITQMSIENAVSKAAREIRTGQAQTAGVSKAQFKIMVCNNVLNKADCQANLNIDIRKFNSFAQINLPPGIANGELTPAVTINSDFSIGKQSDVVVVRTFYKYKLIVPDISNVNNLGAKSRIISTAVTFRNEVYD